METSREELILFWLLRRRRRFNLL